MSQTQPPSTSAALPGYLFLLYSFACLALALWLAHWPHPGPDQDDRGKAPPVSQPTPKRQPPVDIQVMKQNFYDQLLPAIRQQNQTIRQQRQLLLSIAEQQAAEEELSSKQRARLESLAQLYKVPEDTPEEELLETLLRRADVVPASMVLAQAAIESAWGRSRFAAEGNNYFGQWCFSPGCGIVPSRRPEGARHEVQVFDSLDEAVASYLRNINTHPAYTMVREARVEIRQQNQPLDSLKLVEGLEKYSARGEDYIHELQQMIRYNNLKQFDHRADSQQTLAGQEEEANEG